MAVEFVWMRHPETEGQQRFPARAAEAWESRGWERCDPPADLPWRQDPRYVDLPAEDPKPAPAKSAAKTPAAKAAGDPKEKTVE